ncbi:iron chelate uptake ABC transporter family permease subunit [Glutamicibacter sp. JC586]|uniref:iron chelate uptake ABC transporter family permease subunit n=1 Tax=Glutamicibacter sp. JC586 TaxID=2590552 RepID=UPI00135A48B9|nr:iron chelate uptake ABC transporter family permease subunit [Glutamicibacter sp. JC586]
MICAGPIGFVALVAPHITYAMSRSRNLVVCALTGGMLLMLSDLVAQYALPVVLPVGMVTNRLWRWFIPVAVIQAGRVGG